MRQGICIGKIPCSRRKNGKIVAVGGRTFPKCYLTRLVDCRYLVLTSSLSPLGQELLKLLK